MDIFGIGPLEFILILLIALIIFGPSDMAKAGRTLGRSLRRLVMSEEWRIIAQSAREIRHFPERMMREAGVEEIKKELPDLRKDADLDGLSRDISDWQREVSGWTKQTDTQTANKTNFQQPTITPPVKKPSPKPATQATPISQSGKGKFSWDEPDIAPVEDEAS
jgi:hypothetical protein